MHQNESISSHEDHQKLYREYAIAAEAYAKRQTIHTWEKKEKALETYNALVKDLVKILKTNS